MSVPPRYVLDSNVFIEAAKEYYAFDIALQFWRALIEQARNGRVQSIDRVKKELDRGNDPLKDWANNDFHQWFTSTDQDAVAEAYRQIMVWAHNQVQFTDYAKAEFADEKNADAWVVAYAKAKRCVVTTHEVFNPDIKRKIPIPNVCKAFYIQYVDTF